MFGSLFFRYSGFLICCVEITKDNHAFITSRHIQNELLWCYVHLLKRIKQYISSDVLTSSSKSSTCFTKSSKKRQKVDIVLLIQLSFLQNFTTCSKCKLVWYYVHSVCAIWRIPSSTPAFVCFNVLSFGSTGELTGTCSHIFIHPTDAVKLGTGFTFQLVISRFPETWTRAK